MSNKYITPKFKESAFHCPICNVYAKQYWQQVKRSADRGYADLLIGKANYDTYCAYCYHCKDRSLWTYDTKNFTSKMIFPESTNVPSPNEDLNQTVRRLYNEAALILRHSPRASCALLRLALETLCMKEGANDEVLPEGERRLSDRIKYLANEKGLSVKIVEAFHNVRHAGNEALHTGEINLTDNQDIANELFDMINIIADDLITRNRKITELHKKLTKPKEESKTEEVQKKKKKK